jgi:hypothetical protein
LEKGEVAILTGQFAAIAIALLVLSNFANASTYSTPSISTVYWGAPSGNLQLARQSVNTETTNASTISVFYQLATSTSPGSAGASRLCLGANDTGETYTYAKVSFLYDAAKKSNYISFGPAGQAYGQTCTYTVTLIDSLQQVTSWVATIQLKAPTAT